MMEPNGPLQDAGTDGSSGNASIDRVLTALRAAEPAPGLEDRLLRRLAAPTPARRSAWLSWVAPAAIAACVALMFLLSSPRAKRQATAHVASSGSAPASSFRPEQVSTTVARSGENRISDQHSPCVPHSSRALCAKGGVAASAAEVDQRLPKEPRLQSLRSSPAGSTQTESERIRHDAVCPRSGLSDVGCPQSYPAPELPLTEQERLLIRIAHRGDPVQIAALDPVTRELELAHERAETKRFFTPPPRAPEIQHDIDEAMKSQTLITPNTDRTVP